MAVGALVQDDAAFAADSPEQALDQLGELVKLGDGWAFAVAGEGVIVWCVIQFVCPRRQRLRRRRSATAGGREERSTSRADIRRRGVTAQRARYVCDLQRDARRYNRSITPEGVNEVARLEPLRSRSHVSR